VRGSDAAEGMRGSGIFVLNPPWYLQKNLQQVMPYLVKYLAQNDQAEFILEYHENPV
jgi:23S rRNA (adenine2030-N6)-methyltransferase